jgi:hypothetical protein
MLLTFLNLFLDKENNALYNEEFFFPKGVIAAVGRKQIVIAHTNNNTIVGALRFTQISEHQYINLLFVVRTEDAVLLKKCLD